MSLTFSYPAGSALLAYSQSKQDLADEGEDDIPEPSQPACPAYDELLEVMDCTSARLDLECMHEKGEIARSILDEQFLSGHKCPGPVSLPFLSDLHSEIQKANHIQPGFIDTSMLIMLMSRGCVSMCMF